MATLSRSMSKINDSGDDPTLASMVEESEAEHDQQLSTAEQSKSLKWQASAKLVRNIRKFNYLKEEPKEEVSGKSLFFKSLSTRTDHKSKAAEEQLLLVSAEAENEEDDNPLKQLAFKYRVAASLLSAFVPHVYKQDGGYEKWINDFLDLKVKANPKPVDGIYTNDVVIDKECDVWARIFAPSETTDSTTGKDIKHPVVVYFHGGGFATCSPNSSEYDKFCRKLAKASNSVLISVNYRLTPAFKHPVQYEDSFKALLWLKATKPGSDSLPVTADLSRCFLGGDSAGGNITHHVACQAAKTDLGPINIRGLIMLQPFFGGEEKTKSEVEVTKPVLLTNYLSDWFWRAFLPPGANKNHESCNVFGPNSPDISNLPLPSIFLAIGTHDILKDRQVQYAKNMALIFGEENITVKKYIMGFHGFFALDVLLQKALFTDVSAFVKAILAKLPQE